MLVEIKDFNALINNHQPVKNKEAQEKIVEMMIVNRKR